MFLFSFGFDPMAMKLPWQFCFLMNTTTRHDDEAPASSWGGVVRLAFASRNTGAVVVVIAAPRTIQRIVS